MRIPLLPPACSAGNQQHVSCPRSPYASPKSVSTVALSASGLVPILPGWDLVMTTQVAERIGEVESRWIRVGDWDLHARVSVDPVPAGRLPVVLLHGLVVSSRYMVPTAEQLASHHSAYALDLPGFGKSAKPRHVLTIA